MLNPVRKWRHVVVGAAALATPVLAVSGLVGGGTHDERFDAKQVVVSPDGADGVRIREVVDQDFGTNDRHGYERNIPTDFGAATDVEAYSPDASADVSVVDFGSYVRIRLGDPDVTTDGQHRYVLSYTLPDARLSTGELALDIIGHDEEFETERFEVVLVGFELQDPTCSRGTFGSVGGCAVIQNGGIYRMVIESLRPGEGITVGGTILSLSEPTEVAIPPLPDRRDDNRLPLTLATLGIGAVVGLGGYRLARQLGRNEVGGTGPADAAFAAPGAPTRLVADAELDAMATTEFVPPAGLRPWQGAVLLNEQVDATSVSAWFSDQIAQEHIVLEGSDPQVLRAGPNLAKAPVAARDRLESLIGSDGELVLGSYQPRLATLWSTITAEQREAISESGWWTKHPPGTTPSFPAGLVLAVVAIGAATGFAVWKGLAASFLVALGLAVVIPAVMVAASYSRLLPVRSAAGTAAALRVESFRRFLQASEGTHVDWAWSHGLLREYSAWAVALGAAEAWGRAVGQSAVPPADITMSTMPLLMYTSMGSWSQTRTQPSQSSGGGGGGFSGGFSGGGGGGGSSGSW